MAVFLRSTIMLVVLVGLPAAWIWYGPLPAGPQRLVDRALEVTKDSLGWQPQQTTPMVQPPVVLASAPDSRMHYDPQFTPALAELPVEASPAAALPAEVAAELSPHLQVLLELGVSQYTLEHWGQNGSQVRFRCEVPLGSDQQIVRHFDAIAANPLAAVRQVVGEVSSFGNARLATDRVWR